MFVFIVEAQLIEHPEYETFVAVYSDKKKALEECVLPKLNEEIDDLGEDDEIVIKEVLEGHTRVEIEGGSVYFITKTEVK